MGGGSDGSGADQAWWWRRRGRRRHRKHGRRPRASREADRGDRRPARRDRRRSRGERRRLRARVRPEGWPVSWPQRDQLHFPSSLPGAPSVPMNRTGSEHQGLAAGDALPHGTTIVALTYPGGVVMAGDRRATQGNMIASRDVKKVYITDDYTATGIAGTAAIAVEFARLYAVELEHYEKV